MMDPLVSVIIPAYNASCFIRQAIESVFLQTYRPVETIVVDDGSTDRTPNILLSFGKHIQCLRQENKGPASARNLALSIAKGQYITFLDADDEIMPEKLEKQVEILETSPAIGWTYCDVEYVDREGRHMCLASNRFSYSSRARLNGLLFSELLQGNFIPVHAPLVRRDCLYSVAPFDEDKQLIGVEDWDLLLRLALRFHATYSPEVLAKCVLHSASLSANPQVRDDRRFCLLNKTISVYKDEIEALGITGRKIAADTHNWFAYRHIDSGQRREALRRLTLSVTTYPLQRHALWVFVVTLIQVLQSHLLRR